MITDNPIYHNGKIAYNEFIGTSIDSSGLTISLDAVIEKTEEEIEKEEEESSIIDTMVLAGINRASIR